MVFSYLKQQWQKNSVGVFFSALAVLVVLIALCQLIRGERGTWSAELTGIPIVIRSRSIQPPSSTGTSARASFKTSKGQLECRRVLETLYPGYSFPSARPDFLNNPVTGGKANLELDCYNPTLAIAVEYNGRQHYEYTSYFHPNKDAFYNQRYRDDLKRRLCAEHGITLIEVPYTVKQAEIRSFLTQRLRAAGKL